MSARKKRASRSRPTGGARRRRGRPPIPWRDDPDRYRVAFVDAIDAMGRRKERAGVIMASFTLLESKLGNRGNRVVCEKPKRPGTVDGALDKIRSKRRKWPAESARWRSRVAAAIAITILPRNRTLARAMIVMLTSQVGEERFAYDVLLPMLDERDCEPN